MSWDMYESDAADASWERYQESIRKEKRIVALVEVFKNIDPSVTEAREAWTRYKNG